MCHRLYFSANTENIKRHTILRKCILQDHSRGIVFSHLSKFWLLIPYNCVHFVFLIHHLETYCSPQQGKYPLKSLATSNHSNTTLQCIVTVSIACVFPCKIVYVLWHVIRWSAHTITKSFNGSVQSRNVQWKNVWTVSSKRYIYDTMQYSQPTIELIVHNASSAGCPAV